MADCSAHTLLVAIRAKCMDCSGNSRREVERCGLKTCPLYPFRSVAAIGGTQGRPPEIQGQVDIMELLAAHEKEEEEHGGMVRSEAPHGSISGQLHLPRCRVHRIQAGK